MKGVLRSSNMMGKYFVSGFIKQKPEDEWDILRDLPAMTDNYEELNQAFIRGGINYFIYTVRRNKKWEEFLRSQISTAREDSGNKSSSISNPTTSSTSSETQSTEDPMDTT